ncbi:sugar ABC transporter permease [Nocardioides sp. GXQ0305]|uniref:sugar ABC transporter permease n=1 Tax=Nocardioides sp. GXQ0305 TaxID=3423912 RepID=UPI003D7D764F
MSTDTDTGTPTSDSGFSADLRSQESLGDALRDYLGRVRGGEIGSLPAILGLVALYIVFGLANEQFLGMLNQANLVVQAGSICVLAMGLVFVLLLGEIDLSAGVAGGVSAGITALAIVDHGASWWVAVLVGMGVGAVIGLVIGLLVAYLGIPSFVVTLAFFLGLQGVTLRLIGQGGSVAVRDEVLRGLAIQNIPVVAGWIGALVVVAGYGLVSLRRYQVQTRRKLQRPPFALVALKIAGLAAVVLTITGLLNQNRSPREGFVIQGIPWTLPVVAVLLVFWTFVLGRTAFGRHLYAVGGNAEAARRAGITVPRMKVAAFMICSTMAAVAGVLAAAYSGKVSPSSGGGNVLLYAVGAAVIGGTSLFGGRGRAVDAVIGGVVIAVIANGLGLLNQASYINYIVTGAVLLLAASVDAISRRRRSAAGI